MMQRRKIRGADIKPNPHQYVGMINAEKCIAYLRGIGVEIDDATADAWLDTQGVHRFLRSEKRYAKMLERWSCYCGAMTGTRVVERGKRQKKVHVSEAPHCEECGASWVVMTLLFVLNRDGSTVDYRPASERWQRIPSELLP